MSLDVDFPGCCFMRRVRFNIFLVRKRCTGDVFSRSTRVPINGGQFGEKSDYLVRVMSTSFLHYKGTSPVGVFCCLVTKTCLTLWGPMDYSPPGSSVHGDSPGKHTGVGCYALLPVQVLLFFHLCLPASPCLPATAGSCPYGFSPPMCNGQNCCILLPSTNLGDKVPSTFQLIWYLKYVPLR